MLSRYPHSNLYTMNRQEMFCLLMLVVIAAVQAAPMTNNNLTPTTSNKIPALKVTAMHEAYSVLTEIQQLEAYTVRYS